MLRTRLCPLVLLVPLVAFASESPSRELTIDDRVAAQEAIERVYYVHQLDAAKPFEEAVPKEVLQRKVERYLKQSVALESFWQTPVTAEMLQHELTRMHAGSQMPERLEELFAALGDDPVLIQECLARATLVDRLTRNFFAFDARIHATARAEAETLRGTSIQAGTVREERDVFHVRVPAQENGAGDEFLSRRVEKRSWDEWWGTVSPGLDATTIATVAVPVELPGLLDVTCAADYTWDNGLLDDVPLPRYEHTAVWTGSLMLVWGGCAYAYCEFDNYVNTGYRYDPATDSWTTISTEGAPARRYLASAVWTGSLMVVWGGDGVGGYLDTGGRYDPLTDSWTATSTVGAPSPRYNHAAVWSGSEMLIWDGDDNVPGQAFGARYDPVADSWAAISQVNAPSSRRSGHSAVWTGTEMLVWGGSGDTTGGRYDPATDNWTATSTVGAPSSRGGHSAVWTGDRMVIWGGAGNPTFPTTGGQYDPVSDSWTPTSTVNAPSARYYHTTVWTGDRMVVWGGWDESGIFGSGGRYDPELDTWEPTSEVSAPIARIAHTAVWTGDRMVVWGGVDCNDHPYCLYFNTGGRYDPISDSWTPTSTTGAPSPRYDHTAVWTGSRMVVWGGYRIGPWENPDSYLNTGGRYDPATDSWAPTTTTDAPAPRHLHTAIWTGSHMVVWGGANCEDQFHCNIFDTGGRYDPVSDSWRPTSTTDAAYESPYHTAVWTGSRMLIWSGESTEYIGGRYDPVNDTWTPMAREESFVERIGHTAVWTGDEMLVWGGKHGTPLDTGLRYDPDTDVWTPMSTTDAPQGRWQHTAVWTGNEMVVWGGNVRGDVPDVDPIPVRTGGMYDPTTDSWTELLPALSSRFGHTAVWTGDLMLIWGGEDLDGPLNDGGWFDPYWEHWGGFSPVDAPSTRLSHSAVWTGSHMLIWGGWNEIYLGDGGRLALGHAEDGDGDGLTRCEGDCNDDNAWIYPSAPEVCDGYDNQCPEDPGYGVIDPGCNKDGDRFCDGALVVIGFPAICTGGGGDCDDDDPLLFPDSPEVNDGIDNQCPGDPGYGVIDETSGDSGFHDPNGTDVYSWPEQEGATEYEVVRSDAPDFGSACVFWTTPDTSIPAEIPAIGSVHFYLNRPIAPLIGSWGQDSDWQERVLACAGGD